MTTWFDVWLYYRVCRVGFVLSSPSTNGSNFIISVLLWTCLSTSFMHTIFIIILCCCASPSYYNSLLHFIK